MLKILKKRLVQVTKVDHFHDNVFNEWVGRILDKVHFAVLYGGEDVINGLIN